MNAVRTAIGTGVAAAALGVLAWALAATSMGDVQAAEAALLGPGHTPDLPGEDELALVAHDARLAGVIVLAVGTGLFLSPALGRLRGAAGLPLVLAGTALVLNVVLGRAVDGGSVPVAAAALAAVLLTVAAAFLGLARLLPPRSSRLSRSSQSSRSPGSLGRWWVRGHGCVAAGLLPALVLQGLGGERYAAHAPAALALSNVATFGAAVLVLAGVGWSAARTPRDRVLAVALPVLTVLVLLGPSVHLVQVRHAMVLPGLALALGLAPLLLVGALALRGRLIALGVLAAGLALAPVVVVLPAIAGGFAGLVLTAPAGAYVNYDGLPVVGGALVLGAAVFVALLAVDAGRERVPTPAPRVLY